MTTAPVFDSAIACLVFAMDVGSTKWVCAFGSSLAPKVRMKTVAAGDLDGLRGEVGSAKASLGLAESVPVFCCYEAGRDGFWLQRVLATWGYGCLVIDPGSLPLERRAKRVKTDRLDAQSMQRELLRHLRGEYRLSVARIPTEEAEDMRHLERERLVLRDERTRVCNESLALLALHGIKQSSREMIALAAAPPEDVEKVQGPRGPLPTQVRRRFSRQIKRLAMIQKQLSELEAEFEERLGKRAKNVPAEMVQMLVQWRGIGETSARQLVLEAFAWREFENRKKAGALLGAVSAPYESDQGGHEQGISKAGNKRLRATMVEISWLWVRYQPDSALTKWFLGKWGPGCKRARLIGIVALARRLFIALWRYVAQGVVIEGAVFKPKKAAA